MLQIISLIFTILGGVLMTYATVKYVILVKTSESYLLGMPKYSKKVTRFSFVLMLIFIIGYIVGIFDIIRGVSSPAFYFICFIYFLVSVFSLNLMAYLKMVINLLSSKTSLLEDANLKILAQNSELRAESDIKHKDLVKQDRLLHAVNDAVFTLLNSDVENFEEALWKSMGMLAESVDVDRVYIWKNHEVNEKLYCTQVYEWSEGAAPQQNNEYTIDIPYDENMPGWEEALSNGRSVNGVVSRLSQAEQDQLAPQGIISILVVPVFMKNYFWGFVGFDDCHEERSFNEVEEGILRSASLTIATSMLKNEMTLNLMQAREEALSSTRAKSNFLSSMSHEIRTPINAITGMATLARKANNIEKVYDCLDKVDAASRQLLGLINDILDMSKIEADKMEIASEPFDLHATLHNVKSIIGVRAAEKSQKVNLKISEDMPSIFIGDDMRLSQILINLLSNAVKFTPENGDIGIEMSLLERQGDVCSIKIDIIDTGIGIAEDQIARLFLAFEQAEKNTVKKFGGTGLGLSISKRISQLMGGDISVKSKLGEGSCFTVTVCLKAGTEKDILDKLPIKDNDEDFSGITILLVEDIDINREIVLALLEDRNIDADFAVNGEEAVEKFTAAPNKYDMVFMDVHMPVMDGYEATKLIRSMGDTIPEALAIPIIAMTANAFEEDIRHCLDSGMNNHVSKPIDVDRLYQIISKYRTKHL